jgi:hypothetical protein
MFILKKLNTPFAKTQLWKQLNKLKDRSTVNMNEGKLQTHCEALRFIQRDQNKF